MIVADGSKEYRLITQNDHGDLAGQFAAHWGNDQFARLNPYDSMVLAAETHDNGWWDWDIKPCVDDRGVPITFHKTPRDRRSAFYGKGIDNTLAKDLYAGLIVSMHGVGLPLQRYGTLTSMTKREDEHSLKFISDREPSHEVLKEEVGKREEYSGVNSTDYIWFNYRLMQVFDRLSLFFCCNFDIQSVADSSSQSGTTIKPTPVRFGREDEELTLKPVGNSKVKVDPYPFDEAPLKVGVRGRLIPRRVYKEEEFKEVYGRQQRRLFEFTIAPM